MMEDGTYTAVLDRFEVDADDRRLAVLVVEVSEESVDDLVAAAEELPEDARRQDAVLEVSVADGKLSSADYRPEETQRRAEDAQSRFDRLSRRPDDDGE